MMILATGGRDTVIEPYITYEHGEIELHFQATHPQMTTGFLAWMLEGWLDLVGFYGWWEERLELRHPRLGMLAIGTIKKAS